MKILFLIIFASLAIVYFLQQYFNKQRAARQELQNERNRERFENMLKLLNKNDDQKKEEGDKNV